MARAFGVKGERATRKPVEAKVAILVASVSSNDAALVRQLLAPESDHVFLSTNLAVNCFWSVAGIQKCAPFDIGMSWHFARSAGRDQTIAADSGRWMTYHGAPLG